MNIRDCEYIVAVAELGHFSRAAERCNVSQSTLSIQIKKLEDLLDTPIFERTNRQVMLTPAGAEICKAAKAILMEVAHIKSVAQAAKNPMEGELRLGAFPTLAPYFFPRAVPLLKKRLPKLRLFLVEEKTEILLHQLIEGTLDCALIALPVENPKLQSLELFWEPFHLAVPAGHPLAPRKRVSGADLKYEELLLLEEGHCLRGQSLEFCANIGAGESSRYRATSLETLRNMVAAGGGITVLPESAIGTRRTDMRIIPFVAPAPGRSIGLVWRVSDTRNQLYTALGKILKEA